MNKTIIYKIVAFVLTLLVIFLHDYMPKRSLTLAPKASNHLQHLSDISSNGNSRFSWLDKSQLHWRCDIKVGSQFPFCGLSFEWSEDFSTTIDFSAYDNIEVDLEYKGDGQRLRLYVLNIYGNPQTKEQRINEAKYNNILLATPELKNRVTIPLKDFVVPHWWVAKFNVPREESYTDLTQTIAMGIVDQQPGALGTYEYKLNSISLTGQYFSKETLYIGIIIVWAFFILSDILMSYAHLRRKLLRDERALKELSVKNAQYKEKSETDKLTGASNREGLEQIIENLQSKKLLRQYALLVLDLDLFKVVNDEHGHVIGDKVLEETAQVIRDCMRSYDILSRWGGEEFVILFHCLDSNNILPFAEKIRQAIESRQYIGGKLNNITVSIGATSLSKLEPFENAFIRADKALYEAKESGRNKSVVN